MGWPPSPRKRAGPIWHKNYEAEHGALRIEMEFGTVKNFFTMAVAAAFWAVVFVSCFRAGEERDRDFENGVEECRALLGIGGHVPLEGLRECERLGVKFFKD